MKGLSAKFHIALGESLLVVSLLLTALFLGLVPDRIGAVRESRQALAEALAVNSSIFVGQKDINRLHEDLKLVVERNDDILSAGVLRINGEYLVAIGAHKQLWQNIAASYSTDSQIQVPIWAGQRKWGYLQLRCRPLSAPGWQGQLSSPRVRLIAFMGLCCFILFYVYLSRMLRHLDPSNAVPGRVRSALDTLTEGLLVIDHNEYIVLANQSFAATVGKAPEQLVGCKISELDWSFSDDDSEGARVYPWTHSLSEGSSQRKGLLRLADVDGKSRTFIVNCSPVLGDGDKNGGVLISFQDITQLEEKEVALRVSIENAETANRAKSEFLANMSHEIRTPMNAILGFTEVLKRGYGKNQGDSTKYLDTIHSSGKHLLTLINDILDLSKVESGRLEIDKISCQPHEIIREVIQVIGIKAQEKNISLDFEVMGSIPETIVSDPARLRQIVTNLLGNAIKFTDKGGVKIVLSYHQSNNESALMIDVIDTGIGVSNEKLGVIFDPFVQADSSVHRTFGGTGLGLAISRKFARALDGDIKVSSEFGKGTTFTVSIDTGPLDGVNFIDAESMVTLDQVPQSAEHQHWEFPSANILVVDDGKENRELLQLVLEDVGLQVVLAENGRVGLEKTQQRDFDIILMDIQMPVMDGFTAVGLMREHGIKVPIIALTANAMKGVEEECLAAGYSGYQSKPLDLELLIETLAELLQLSPSQCDVRTDTIGSEEDVNFSDDEWPIVSRLSDNDRYHPIIRTFAERLDVQLGQMDLAWKNENYDTLASLAHWLKGAGGTVGFDAFTEPAKELEKAVSEKQSINIESALRKLRYLSDRIVIPGIDNESGSITESQTSTVLSKSTNTSVDSVEVSRKTDPIIGDCAVVSRLGEDPRFKSIIVSFVERLRQQLTEMDRSWREKNYEELASLAHWLKGAGGTVGFDEFTKPAACLEIAAEQHDDSQIEEVLVTLADLAEKVVVPDQNVLEEVAANGS